ncbi:MAG: manganese efflux pump [Clostridia bacterium]|nr:manganese efflux pump [Clostridia bacterium]
MDFLQIGLIAIGLSMDAFAVSMCKGLGMKRLNRKHAFIIALFFGGFQALMPLIGWFLGTQFEQYIQSVDHWIAFGLLAYIGGKMLWDAIRGDDSEEAQRVESKLDVKELVILAIATSIDALAAGITFAVLKTPIVPAVTLIGLITLALCFIGVSVGFHFGSKYEKAAQITGGVVLILIGLKILLEHLELVSFPF